MSLPPGTVFYVISDEQLVALEDRIVGRLAALINPAPSFLPDRPLNQRELARMLGVGTATIRQWEQRGDLTGQYDGNAKRYAPETIAAFLKRRLDGET